MMGEPQIKFAGRDMIDGRTTIPIEGQRAGFLSRRKNRITKTLPLDHDRRTGRDQCQREQQRRKKNLETIS
jgi:hypothetical protein